MHAPLPPNLCDPSVQADTGLSALGWASKVLTRGGRSNLDHSERQKQYLRLCLCDVDVVLLIVVVQADAISPRKAGEAPQRHLQHCFGIADVQEILRRVQETLYGPFSGVPLRMVSMALSHRIARQDIAMHDSDDGSRG